MILQNTKVRIAIIASLVLLAIIAYRIPGSFSNYCLSHLW